MTMKFIFFPLLFTPCLVSSAKSNTTNTATITVDLNSRYQTIDGFGISQSFQRAAQVYGKNGLTPRNRQRVLDFLFSDESGAGLTIVRNGIGSSADSEKDFMNSIEPLSPGLPSSPPQYVWDGNDSSQVWFTQEAMKYGVKNVYADAWSAPAFMKTNGNDSNGGFLCGVPGASCESGDWRQAFADYLVQYLRFYRESGINVTHLGFLNEPDLTTTYASMRSSGVQAGDFLNVLYPTLQAHGFSDVKLVCCEATGWTTTEDLLYELSTVPGAAETLSVISSHGYQADPKLPLNTPHHVWQTEWADLQGDWNPYWDVLGKAGEGLPWANKIQQALTLSNCSAFLYWIGAETTQWNSALIQLNNETFEVSARLWAFGQFSRFVKPGAVRVEAETEVGVLRVSAFVDGDGGLSVLVINNGHMDHLVDVELDELTEGQERSVTTWLTNNSNNLTRIDEGPLADGQGDFVFRKLVPARSMVSFLVEGGGSR